MGIEEIEKNRFIFGTGTGQGRIEAGLPFDLLFHNRSSFLKLFPSILSENRKGVNKVNRVFSDKKHPILRKLQERRDF
jgi:hypothetical protein